MSETVSTFEQAKEIVETISFETARDEAMTHLDRVTAPSDRALIVAALQLLFERGRQLGYCECIITCDPVLGSMSRGVDGG